MSADPLIVNIKGNSLDDGPGIRSVVFFKGCPLNCSWCHNPECISAKQEIFYDREKCIGCGCCIETCPEAAISRDNPLYVDRESCSACLDCTGTCPAAALTAAGSRWEVEAAVKTILKDKPFFKNSGGGATLSGGEPALHPSYTGSLLRALKKEKIHTLVETCGYFDFISFNKEILPHADTIYFDLKLIDPEAHKRFCGVSNELILNNLIRLHGLSHSGSFTLLPRIPLVPSITATKENLSAAACFLKRQGFTKASLLPYNPLWGEKLPCLGKTDPYPPSHHLRKWMSREEIVKCRELFTSQGLCLE